MASQRTPSRIVACPMRVTALTRVCRDHLAIEFDARLLPPSHPGQFIQILCSDDLAVENEARDWPDPGWPGLNSLEWQGHTPVVRRPFSIADRCSRDGDARALIISRRVGIGTGWLDQLEIGDSLNITGPLGSPFRIDDVQRPLLLIGGGVGIPPMLYLARRLRERGADRVGIVFGAMSRDLFVVPMHAEPAHDGAPTNCLVLPGNADYPAIVTTDDGSIGLAGRVTSGLAVWADRWRGENALVYACGPEPMLHAIARKTRELQWDCQLCIERTMACGLGTCLSCVVRTPDASKPTGWRWALSCSEGPAFDRDALLDFRD